MEDKKVENVVSSANSSDIQNSLPALSSSYGSSQKKLLIVDDSAVNRSILNGILGKEYLTVQAENGKDALKKLEENKDIILVLLDLGMPVMNGYEFLEAMSKIPAYIGIPVIVTTANDSAEDEIKSLGNGASDFITKPYNPEIVRRRVASIIRLRETSNMLSILEFDQLTGVYSKEAFYQHAAWKIQDNPTGHFSILCCDVKDFKLINEMYSIETGDKILHLIADSLRYYKGDEMLCGRIGADVFAVLRDDTKKIVESELEPFYADFSVKSPVESVSIKFGFYGNVDRSIPVSRMCSRALLALEQIKQNPTERIAYYIDWEKKQQVLNDFETAVKEKQFKMYLQPKYDIQNDCIGGAEALVRWIHPERGLIPPNDFIPLFEEKGYITQLDFYMWEAACQQLQSWMSEGKELFPISVNMSRLDINTPDLVKKIVKMVNQYAIPREMLHFEVLERAYAENPEKLIKICSDLQESGFKIEMDDFGSGNSSLNMLSILPIDYLKLDMKFLQTESTSDKKSILSAIVSLSKWLGLDAIAEGVERSDQLERLKGMGCRYVQGYYFSKPLPIIDFDEFVKNHPAMNEKIEPVPVEEMELSHYKILFAQKKLTILVVEDVDITRETLCNMLSPYFNMISAEDGMSALKMLGEHSDEINMVLLDLMIPRVDGFQVLEIMRKSPKLKNIPVIITSESGKESELQSIRIGADGYVSKPYYNEILLNHIKNTFLLKGIIHE